tara:strand:- start:496 stop:714 length:219 start_codon:yes stop_codon:yes gene_type:complete
MTKITLTETGIIALTGMVIAFLINCCKTIMMSRCKAIKFCFGLIEIQRVPLSGDTIIELDEIENQEIKTPSS